MLEGLVKVTNEKGKLTVSARELYFALELNKTHWKRWYEKNIINNEFFVEARDWVGFAIMANGNETIDFTITLEMAKHLAMMSRTKKSHEIRNYFIDCEQYIIKTNQIDRFNKFRKEERRDTYNFYQLIGDDGKCVALSKCLYSIVSYKYNLDFIHNKKQIVALAKYGINEDVYEFYLELKTKAESFVDTFMDLDEEHFMHNTIELLKKKFIDNVESFNKYCETHKEEDLEFKIEAKEYKGVGFGKIRIHIPKN